MAQTLLSFWGKPAPPVPEKVPEPIEDPQNHSQELEQPSPAPPAAHKARPERPSYKVVLKLDPEVLRPLKPKKHAFFAPKKYTTAKQEPKLTVKQRTWPLEPVAQVLPPRVEPPEHTLERRKRQEYAPSPQKIVPIPAHSFERSHKCVKRTLTEAELEPLKATEKTPFDCGEYDKQLWTSRYAPQSYKEHINRKAAREVARWLYQRFKTMKTRPLKKRRRVDDFDEFVDDNDMPFMIVQGPRGSGKTSAVYAACTQFSALTVEINQTTRKSSATLKEMLSGLAQSHIVHANAGERYHCAVLIDEADVDLDEDTTFWTTLRDFASKSKRPIVLTCETLNLPSSVLDSSKIVKMPLCDPVPLVRLLASIAIKQGFMMNTPTLAKLVVLLNFDLRACLMHLNFWCQMGVGGSLAATEWLARADDVGRTISDNNYVELPPVWLPAPEPESLAEVAQRAESLSLGFSDSSQDYFKRVRPIRRDWRSYFPIEPLESGRAIITELLPIMRDIARGDLDRREAARGMRRTKRSLESFGMDSEFFEDPEYVLRTWKE